MDLSDAWVGMSISLPRAHPLQLLSQLVRAVQVHQDASKATLSLHCWTEGVPDPDFLPATHPPVADGGMLGISLQLRTNSSGALSPCPRAAETCITM